MFYISILHYFQGYLTVISRYTNPFEIICVKCSTPITSARTMNKTMFYYITCKQDSRFLYFQRVKCFTHANDRTEIKFFLRSLELERVLPALWKKSYEQYCAEKTYVIEIFSNFETHGTFTINHQNIVICVTT